MKKVKVGVIGCGGICRSTYMDNMMYKFNVIEVVGCADLIDSRAQYMADTYGIKKMTNEEIYNDPEIQVVVNLTYPESHFEVTAEALKHGKHVYCEKMMAPTFEEAKELARLAEENHVSFTTAPDTFLGAWEQSARKYLDDGIIGKPVTVHAQITAHYEPSTPYFDLAPKYFFFPLHYGGGFPFDLGGYYLHEMINLLGSVKRVTGFGGNLNPVRKYTNPRHPKYGEDFIVNTPTTLMAALEFENGTVGTFHISSDSNHTRHFEITGTEGVLNLGDPNSFSSLISVTRAGADPKAEKIAAGQTPTSQTMKPQDNEEDIQNLGEACPTQTVQLPILHGYSSSSRGIGLADMCYALLNGRKPRCHYDIGLHAIEVIHGIQESCTTGRIYEMTTRCERPAPIRPSALSLTGQEATLDD
ncbi:MAG: Gfo/Idh/MocA family oxidoreductase [Clostridia bacterium]|nr:Gfo/Idh/MocA family oxidoreductase [Clostridia bacterium]